MNRKVQRRFKDHKPPGKPLTLPRTHIAIQNNTTLFPGKVAQPNLEERIFKSGKHSRKIGDRVIKGPWAGMPIYTLTLEERRTCPKYCVNFFNCYGNKMQWSVRWDGAEKLIKNIPLHIDSMARHKPGGFVIRLHVLGDFFSIKYVAMWMTLLEKYPMLHVFGYTARDPNRDPLAQMIDVMNERHPDRCVIRFSNNADPKLLVTETSKDVTLRGKVGDGIVCPAQTDDTECCGTCGLCWTNTRKIIFLEH